MSVRSSANLYRRLGVSKILMALRYYAAHLLCFLHVWNKRGTNEAYGKPLYCDDVSVEITIASCSVGCSRNLPRWLSLPVSSPTL